ncbi:hypothetical protein V1478_005913 [Vespula squamosa]|uniref:Uncharacterized protein n=1 Tax=Vespula squamosa TaxID=30214 RepID=A0ABD2BA55_VESSQ
MAKMIRLTKEGQNSRKGSVLHRMFFGMLYKIKTLLRLKNSITTLLLLLLLLLRNIEASSSWNVVRNKFNMNLNDSFVFCQISQGTNDLRYS